jgi:DNA polymerase-3 subunit delta
VIHLLYGKDSYQVSHALASIKSSLGDEDGMLASNTTTLDGAGVSAPELLAHAQAVPFLAPHRLVVVEGLLRALGGIKRGRAKKNAPADDPLEPWKRAAGQLSKPETMPESTTLVFVEGDVGQNNAAFTIFAPIARAVEFKPLLGNELVAWVKNLAKRKKLKLTDGAAVTLAKLIGPDLWAIETELDKLDAYAGADAIGEAAVSALVTAAYDEKLWDVADAIVVGDERKALTSMRRLLIDGYPVPVLTSMVVRQYRQLLLMKDLRDRRVSRDETARLSGVPPFKLDDVGRIANQYSWPLLREAYTRLLDADLSIKRGLQDDESALQLLIHDLCAKRPAPTGRPAHVR